MFKTNCCDGKYNSFDVHFTTACDNKCKHCIDTRYSSVGNAKPDVDAIVKTILANQDGYDDVLFLGGEPCLYLEELIKCVELIRISTDLEVYVTTSVPKICYDKRDHFEYLLQITSGVNLSVQHYDESIADEIRQTQSQYNRQLFYNSLPYKEKIRINLNIVKPYLYTKAHIRNAVRHYAYMGFNEMKLSEIQHGSQHFVSFEDIFDVRYGSPYTRGCQTYVKVPGLEHICMPVLLKRSCFMCEETLKANIIDIPKVIYKAFANPDNKYAVIYSDGTFSPTGWR